jgi:hypothetical protein
VAAALLASGCQSHVGTAADVGGTRISTKTLNAAVKNLQGTALATQAGSNLERQVLSDLVLQQQVQTVADRHHVSATAGDIAATATQFKESSAANSNPAEPDSYWQLQGRETATAVAVMRQLSKTTGKFDAVKLYLVPVKTESEGETVLGLLAKNPSAKASIAQQYSTDAGLKATGGEVGIVSLEQLGVAQVSKMQEGDATIATVQSTTAVLVVEARLDEADFSSELTKDVNVKVNPRFGTWAADASTGGFAVVPATSLLSKPDPAKPTDEASPSASAGASAPASAGASAPPATAPAVSAPASAQASS